MLVNRTTERMNAAITLHAAKRGSLTPLNAARLMTTLYLAWLLLSQLDHPQFYAAVPLVFASSVLTLLVLEHFRYDPRSSGVLLLIICQLYFFGRADFISQPWGWYYILGHASYLIFLLGLFAGVKLFAGTAKRQSHEARAAPRPIPKASRLYVVGIATFIGYALGLNYLLSSTGASGSFIELIFQSLATRLAIAETGLSPVLQLMYVLSAFGLGTAYILWQDHKQRLPMVAWLLLMGYSALVLGSRGAIVLPVIQILLATSLLLKRPLRMLAALVVPLVVAVNVFSTWYLAAREGLDALADDNYSVLNRFDAYENWLRFSTDRGFELKPGASIPAMFLQFVPRRLYEDKPYYFSTEMTRIYAPDAFDRGINLDFGGIAESVYNFGPLGPPLFGLFLGWVVGKMDRFRNRAHQLRDPLSAYIFAQGALIPASFFFVGWINTAMIFGVIGFLLTIKIFRIIAGQKKLNGKIHHH